MSSSLHALPDPTPLLRFDWDAGWADAFVPYLAQGLVPGRVVRVDRGRCDVATASGTVLADTALVTPRDPLRVVCTGDWVAVDPVGDPLFVRAVLPRRTAFVRSTSSKRSEAQVLATNIDHLLICVSLAVVPDLGRLERFLALAMSQPGGDALLNGTPSARGSRAHPLVLLTKADLAPDADHIRADVEGVAPGADVLVISAATGRGMDVLGSCLPGTSALIGQSGAGKSTIANVLLGRPAMAVQEIRSGDNKGRHTTTTRELLTLPGGGVLIDTPGLRGVGMYDAAEGLDQAFADIRELAEECRFGDCGHLAEPGCAVLASVAQGALPERRLESYRKLVRENDWIAARSDARLRAERGRTGKGRRKPDRSRVVVPRP